MWRHGTGTTTTIGTTGTAVLVYRLTSKGFKRRRSAGVCQPSSRRRATAAFTARCSGVNVGGACPVTTPLWIKYS
eukprot:COSAG01_NODE_24_length_37608_cov_19.303154_11_plen_75_part_00